MLDVIMMWIVFGILLIVECAAVGWVLFYKNHKSSECLFWSVVELLVLLLIIMGTGLAGWQSIIQTLSSCSS